MSDEMKVVEQDPEEDTELVVVEKEEEPAPEPEPKPDPELVRLREENERLKRGGDASSAIKDGFAFLQEKLSALGVPQTPAAPAPDEEKEWEEIEQQLFDKQPRKALQKAIDKQARKMIVAEIGPIIIGQMEAAFENAEWRLKTDPKDGPVYTRYEKEVFKELSKLPPMQQRDPRELKKAFLLVKGIHADEIFAERAVEDAKPPAPAAPPRKVVMEGATQHPPRPDKKQVVLTRVEDEKRKRLGMSVKDYVAVKEARKASR
jgi:hypothetical protein